MDYFLSEEQIMIRDLARQIAEEKIVPVRAELDETGEFPWDIMKVLAQSDLFGLFIPEEYGGLGKGCLELCIAVEELSRAPWVPTLCCSSAVRPRRRNTFPISRRGRDSSPSV
jgi:alkylation response protein AidB-like acyl-CoA dehydrogenase